MKTLDDVLSDIEEAAFEPDYAAVNTLWLALLKLSNLEDGKNERDRMLKLTCRIPQTAIREIVADPVVDSLLNLEPALERVASHPRERLEKKRVKAALEKVRDSRSSEPFKAFSALGLVLKTIRNKREHGFKKRHDPRDSEILRAARHLLDKISRAAVQARVEAGLHPEAGDRDYRSS